MAEYTEEQRKQYQKLYNELFDCMKNSPQDFKSKLEDALAAGYPINLRGETTLAGGTLLIKAVYLGAAVSTGIPELLLDKGSDPNIQNCFGRRPLIEAIEAIDGEINLNRSAELIKRLIKAGADVNARDIWGGTAFNSAASYCIYDKNKKKSASWMFVVQLLLDHGADPYLCDIWMKAHVNDTEEQTARRRELQELCDAYLTKRNELQRCETEAGIGAFIR